MKREAYNFGYGTFQFSQDRYFMSVWKEGYLSSSMIPLSIATVTVI